MTITTVSLTKYVFMACFEAIGTVGHISVLANSNIWIGFQVHEKMSQLGSFYFNTIVGYFCPIVGYFSQIVGYFTPKVKLFYSNSWLFYSM